MNSMQLAGATLGFLVAASLAGCLKPETAPPTVDKGKIADAVKADWANVAAAANAGDAAKAVASDAPDIVNMFHGQPTLVGTDADLKNVRQLIATGAKVRYSDETVDVADAGDRAVYRSTYDITYTDPKTNKLINSDHGVDVAGYKKQPDGSWKVEWTIFADTPAAAGGV
jgi:ketosteroid isomerase-like protein